MRRAEARASALSFFLDVYTLRGLRIRASSWFGENGEKRFRFAGGAKLFADRLIAQQARDPRERLQMIRTRLFRRKQQEHQIDGLVVHRIIIDGRFQPREQARDLGQAR